MKYIKLIGTIIQLLRMIPDFIKLIKKIIDAVDSGAGSATIQNATQDDVGGIVDKIRDRRKKRRESRRRRPRGLGDR